MPEFFRDRALIWFRNNNGHWRDWKSLRAGFYNFFLSSRYFEKLDEEIRKRTQRYKEPFKEYVLVMQNLMWHANLSEDQKLERIFRNSQPEYQWYIRRKDFQSLPALLELANELESIPTNT